MNNTDPQITDLDLQNYILINKILYRQRTIDGNSGKFVTLVIPTTLLTRAIRSVHHHTHGDRVHTLFKFKLKYYHPNEKTLVRKFVESCDVCRILKGRPTPPIKIKTAPIATKPFQVVSFDFVGPLPVTPNLNKYILVVIDLFSRFAKIYPTPSKNTNIVIKHLAETFDVFGYPETLISDCALEFKSDALKNFANFHGVKKTEVLPYSPHSNGIVERTNGRLNKLLKLYVNTTTHDMWDIFLTTVENAINNQYIGTLGDTPAYTLFARDTAPNLNRTDLNQLYSYDSDSDIIKYRCREIANIQTNIRANIINNTLKRNLQRNLTRKDKNLTIGDRVLLRNHHKNNKLDLAWLGPGIITDITRHKATIRIGNKIFPNININHLLPLRHIAKT